MSNQPNYRRARSLAEFADQRRVEGSIEIPLSDGGDPIIVPPGEFWTTETREVQRSLRRKTEGVTPADVAISVIGAEAFERFAAESEQMVPGVAPGDVFFMYLEEETAAKQGETPGK